MSNNNFKNTKDMDYKYINQLLERYWKCETSLEEENILRTFFSQEEIPAELESYRPLFAYEQQASKQDSLGDDFDQKMMQLIASTDEQNTGKTKVISLTDRLKPLFKAAAVVAIFLTLGNAAQVPFQDDDAASVPTAGTAVHKGSSVAVIGDSLSVDVDSTQHTSINQMPTEPTPSLLKR